MNKFQLYWILITALLIVLTGSAIGCVATTPLEEPASLPATAPNANGTPGLLPKTGSTTPPAAAEVTPTGETLIGCDPVSGRAQEVNLCWEQLCVATGYDVEVAKDKDFNIKVIDWVPVGNAGLPAAALVPANRLEPCAYIPAGGATAGASELALWGNLECGHTYYWRVMARVSATGEIARSPWSDVASFTVKAGLPVTTPYYGPQLLAPDNGCLGCPTKPASFSWSPFKETTKWKFVLAKDAAMTQVIKEAEVTTTAYEYDGTLEYGTSYFWRVMAIEPAPSDWSATFSFQTEATPPPPAAPPEALKTPLWVWVVIAIGAILMVVTLVLIFKTRRT